MNTNKRFYVLRGAIARHGLSIESLADSVGISRTSMSNKMNGHTVFDYEDIVSIIKFFRSIGEDYSADYLFELVPENVE